MNRLRCWLFGHGTTTDWYAVWKISGRNPERREVVTICSRCKQPVARREERWPS